MGTTILSFLIAYWLRSEYVTQWELRRLAPIEYYGWVVLAILVTWSLLLYQYGTYRSHRTLSITADILIVWKSVLIGAVLLGTVIFILKFDRVSRTLIIIFAVMNLVLFAVQRIVIRLMSWVVRKRGYNYHNVVIVGTDRVARDLASRLVVYRHWGMRIVGFVSEGDVPSGSKVDGYAVLCDMRELEQVVQERNIDEVFFAVTKKRTGDLEDALLMLEENGIIARVVPNIFPHMIASVKIEELETVPLLTFSTVPTNVLALYAKRLVDVILASFLLVSSFPAMLLSAIIIKATSQGPVFFSQKRCGLHGRLFTLYKFRSMYQDAEARKKDLEKFNEMEGPVFKIKDDPRVTPFGRFMRKTSIDELPQLWNVLKGDMSIVGPRPPIPEEVGKYERWQRRRLSMRPGLTCLWQISGRNEIKDFNEWVRLDLQYIDTWSLALDLKIFLKTIPVVLLRKGAE